MNQWLVSTPAAILDKATFWKVKAGSWDYNLGVLNEKYQCLANCLKLPFTIFFKVPCPETPFNVPYDPFRDWRECPIKWSFSQGHDWHREVVRGRRFELVEVISSLLYDNGYYFDSYFKVRLSLSCYFWESKLSYMLS